MTPLVPFRKVCGVAAPLFLADINTDTLMPSAWHVAHPDRPGEGLMRLWRYDAEGHERPDFVLNKDRFRQARFLVAGPNFGCGSSRETAVWAIRGYGIRAVIAPSFGEIFRENCFQNGVLPVELPLEAVRDLASLLETLDPPEICVDLSGRLVALPDGRTIAFDIAGDRRQALLEGLDATTLLLHHAKEIDAYQHEDGLKRPWIYRPR
jgi:3-isopropylmalate/(R)-2-methylmalate dehydratase small subunit